MIRQQVYAQAQAQVTSDLEAAKEIYQIDLERLKDALRIHATRLVIYGALSRQDTTGLAEEMERIRQAEQLDVLTLLDASGRVVYRSRNPAATRRRNSERRTRPPRARHGCSPSPPPGSCRARSWRCESPELAAAGAMAITPTRVRARPRDAQYRRHDAQAAAPGLHADGPQLGVLFGGVLLNRNYEIVDKIRKTVFKEEDYGPEVGTATIFQDDVRISTNVRNADGTRAISTQASAEVADAGPRSGGTWRAARSWSTTGTSRPTRRSATWRASTIGMLYVGMLERPYTDSSLAQPLVFLGITSSAWAWCAWWPSRRPAHLAAHARHGRAAQRVAAGGLLAEGRGRRPTTRSATWPSFNR